MPRFTHVIWDWNGTLVDDVGAAVDTVNQLLAARSLPLVDAEQYRRVFDFPVRVYYERLGFDFAQESFAQTCAEWLEHYETRWRRCELRAGARDVLARLSERGVSHSVLSASQHDALHLQAAHHDLHGAIGAWIGQADNEARGKVESGRRWLARQRLDAERVLLVGDTLHDLEVAEELRVSCLLLEGGHHHPDRLRSCGARVCRDLDEILAAVVGDSPA